VSKYGNRKKEVDGYTFDSLAEAARYQELCLLEAAGEIGMLKVHPRYELQPAFTDASGKRQRAITYEADFEYQDRSEIVWRTVVEDVKGGRGTQTAVFKLKAKLFRFKYPQLCFEVVER